MDQGIVFGQNTIGGASPTTHTLGRTIDLGRGHMIRWNDLSDNQIGYAIARDTGAAIRPDDLGLSGTLVAKRGADPVIWVINEASGKDPSLSNALI